MFRPNPQSESAPIQLVPSRPATPGQGLPIAPFLIGTAVGGIVGAVAGTLLSNATRRFLIWLIHLAGRNLSDEERDRLRFDLLLQ